MHDNNLISARRTKISGQAEQPGDAVMAATAATHRPGDIKPFDDAVSAVEQNL